MAYNQYYGARTSAFFPNGIPGWHLKSTTPNRTVQNVNISRDADGHYIESSLKTGGHQAQFTEEWECDGDNSTAPAVTIGKINDTTAVDSATLTTSNSGRPTLSVSGHVHESKETSDAKHLDGRYVVTFAFPTGAYGAVNPFMGAGEALENLNDYEITGSTQTASMNHIDEPGMTGEFLVGASRGVQIAAHLDATTANDVTLGEADNGWVLSSKSQPTTNEGVVKLSVDGTRYIDESGDDSDSGSASGSGA